MKKIISILFLVFITNSIIASQWIKSLDLSLTVNQSKSKTGAVSLNTKESLSYGVLINGELTKDVLKYNWKNTLKLEFARSRNIDKSATPTTSGWTEDIDELKLDSVYRWKMKKYFNPYAAMNIQTAIFDSNFAGEWNAFQPLQLRESVGMGFPFFSEAKHELVGRLGLFYQHYINEPSNIDYETSNGIELVLDYKNQFKKDMTFTSKFGLYSSLKETDNPWDSDKSKKIKLEWDNTLIAKITKYININISFNVDNIDITESDAHYEWEQKLNLAFNYKVF